MSFKEFIKEKYKQIMRGVSSEVISTVLVVTSAIAIILVTIMFGPQSFETTTIDLGSIDIKDINGANITMSIKNLEPMKREVDSISFEEVKGIEIKVLDTLPIIFDPNEKKEINLQIKIDPTTVQDLSDVETKEIKPKIEYFTLGTPAEPHYSAPNPIKFNMKLSFPRIYFKIPEIPAIIEKEGLDKLKIKIEIKNPEKVKRKIKIIPIIHSDNCIYGKEYNFTLEPEGRISKIIEIDICKITQDLHNLTLSYSYQNEGEEMWYEMMQVAMFRKMVATPSKSMEVLYPFDITIGQEEIVLSINNTNSESKIIITDIKASGPSGIPIASQSSTIEIQPNDVENIIFNINLNNAAPGYYQARIDYKYRYGWEMEAYPVPSVIVYFRVVYKS